MLDNVHKTIASDYKYTIVCPYCFNKAHGGDGNPIPHTKVEFRSETSFSNVHEIELKLGIKEYDIEFIDDKNERNEKTKEFNLYKKFISKTDPIYQSFWDNFEGKTTEQPSKRLGVTQKPWELPIISLGNGIERLEPDIDGFVNEAVDAFGRTTDNRVCPFCHNPLPRGFGKYEAKYISIIGVAGSGKTVYISQLLKGMSEYASKVGLNAYFTSDHEPNFIENNKVQKDKPLPNSTSQKRLSQPMFYDIVRNENGKTKTETIVLYDIAGENCRRAEDMANFSQFVKHSDGLVILIDPKQLGFLQNDIDDDIDEPSLVLNTLWSILENKIGEKSNIPVAVCISKSDMCPGILPPISQESIQVTSLDTNGLPKMEFDGKTFNELLMGEHGLKNLMFNNARAVCNNLNNGYWNYNFFAVSAIGCACKSTDNSPINRPEAKRIEEPILWLFKQFGYIKSNNKVYRPFKIPQANRYIYKQVIPLIGKAYLEKKPDEFAVYEEETVRLESTVHKKGEWVPYDSKFESLPIKQKGE